MPSLPSAYADLKPAAVWRHFALLNSIPRPSGDEEAVCRAIQNLAESQRLIWKTDARGNCVIAVPARGNAFDREAPTVVLQSHLDMVCQKKPDVSHDFALDSILPRRENDQIFASGTTLGADNGMGAAMMMALMTSPELTHGPLELLFTVEEETGLYGAQNLDPELVSGRILINLDSEDPGEITIGCAGGAGTELFLPIEREETLNLLRRTLVVGGLQGGHSGIQINQPLGNALKILGEVLNIAFSGCDGLRLVSLEGGTAHNAIPRDATAEIAIPENQVGELEKIVEKEAARLLEQWDGDEPSLGILLRESSENGAPLSLESQKTALELLRELPHGVSQMSERFEGKVQTSTNLAEIRTSETEILFAASNRSFVAAELAKAQGRIADLGRKSGAKVEVRDCYPGWEPRADSPLLRAAIPAFQKATGQTPKVEVVHAGLECGILGEKLHGLDAISFGPLIRGAHTPEEWVSVSSVSQIWRVLTTLLEDLSS